MKGLQAQIDVLKQRLAGGAAGSISELDTQFRDIQMDYEFTTASYKSNFAGLEQARREAVRRLKFLIVVAHPLEIDRPQLPDRTYVTVTTAVVMLVVYFVELDRVHGPRAHLEAVLLLGESIGDFRSR